MVADAAASGVDLIAFPEVFLYIGGRAGKLRHAQDLDGDVIKRFRDQALHHHTMILLGSLHERIANNADKVHNTAVLIGSNGEILTSYRKLKLFDVELPEVRLRESDTVEPGDAMPPVVDTPIGRIGLTICFDLRFPHLYQRLRAEGAEIIFVPSNFTAATGAAHWDVLLRARAIENQVYIAAPAQYGQHNPKYRSHGHSALVNPWGMVTALAPNKPGLTFGDVDLDYLRQVRRELPLG